MKPQEYLENLQSVYSYDQYDYLIGIRDLWAKPLDKDENKQEKPKRADDASYNQYIKMNFEFLLKHLPPDISTVLGDGDHLAVGSLRTADFNGSAIPVPNCDGWVITLQSGISELIYETVRIAFSTHSVQSSSDNTQATSATISFDEAAKLLSTRLNYYVTTGVAYGPDSPTTQTHIEMASFLTTIAERFVLCHEMAHVYLGHHRQDKLCALPEDWNNVSEAIHAHEEEYEADAVGFKLLLSSLTTAGISVPPVFAGASLFLQIADMIEGLTNQQSSLTHPSAAERLNRLRSFFRQECINAGQNLEYFINFETGLSNTLSELKRLVLMIYPYDYSPVLDLLSKCANSLPPNYVRFYMDFFSLLAVGAPHKLCKAIGETRALVEHSLQKYERDGKINLDGASDDEKKSFSHKVNIWKFTAGVPSIYGTQDIQKRIEYYYERKKIELEATQ